MTPRPALLAPTAAANGEPEFPGPNALPLARVKLIVPVDELLAPAAPVAFPPVAIPFTVTIPVEALETPNAVAFVPPVQFPVIVIMPLELLLAPEEVVLDPPIAFPVMFILPELPL